MATKHERFMTPVGVAVFPHITKPDTRFVSEGSYHSKLRLTPAEAQPLIDKLVEIRDAFFDEQDAKIQKTYTKVDPFELELNEEGEETGFLIVQSKMKAFVQPKGKEGWEQAPRLFDSNNNQMDLESTQLWSGSKIRIAGDVVPYAMANGKTVGVSLRMKNVQVIELVAGGGSPFDDYEGGFEDTSEAPSEESAPFSGADDDDDPDY